ncbi:MAG: peptide deformylase [Candidatus Caenarcaniphilales bacterium]|nr:peptide deformylase [Candidatus Caenarcaniphilales bacterium]
MAVLDIYQYGAEVLRNPSREVNKKEIKSKEFKRFVRDMLETMYIKNGVGLAAPQVGINKRVIVIDVDWPQADRNPMILINPKIVYQEGELLSEEGCLSFRGNTLNKEGVQLKTVRRYAKVKVNYNDLDNQRQSIEAVGDLLCRCLQHEIDHLDGVLFIDKSEDLEQVKEELIKSGFSTDEIDRIKVIETVQDAKKITQSADSSSMSIPALA